MDPTRHLVKTRLQILNSQASQQSPTGSGNEVCLRLFVTGADGNETEIKRPRVIHHLYSIGRAQYDGEEQESGDEELPHWKDVECAKIDTLAKATQNLGRNALGGQWKPGRKDAFSTALYVPPLIDPQGPPRLSNIG